MNVNKKNGSIKLVLSLCQVLFWACSVMNRQQLPYEVFLLHTDEGRKRLRELN